MLELHPLSNAQVGPENPFLSGENFPSLVLKAFHHDQYGTETGITDESEEHDQSHTSRQSSPCLWRSSMPVCSGTAISSALDFRSCV